MLWPMTRVVYELVCTIFSCTIVVSVIRFMWMLRFPGEANLRSRRLAKFRIGFCCGGLLYFGTLLVTQNPVLIFTAAILGAILAIISVIFFATPRV